MKKILSVILTLSIAVSALSACGNSSKENTSDSEQTDTIRVAVNSVTSIEYAYEQKYHWIEEAFNEVGVNVEFIQFEYGAPVVEAIAAGDVDVTTLIGDTPFITAYANGTDIEAIYATARDPKSFAMVVAPAQIDQIKTLTDLKGKRIALSVGSNGHDFVIKELESVGLTEDDVEIVNISTAAEMLSALLSNEIDVAANVEPSAANLVAQGCAYLDYGEPAKIAVSVLAARTGFTSENPELTALYVSVIDKIYKAMIANPEEAKEIYSEISELDTSLLTTYDRYVYQGSFTDENVEALNEAVEFLLSTGVLEEEIDLSSAYTDKYYEEALRMEGEQ